MDRDAMRRIEEYRRNEAGPLENNLIDELIGGEMDRTEFLRRGTMFGLSLGMMGGLLGLVGEAGAAPARPRGAGGRQEGRHAPDRDAPALAARSSRTS